MKKQFMMIGFFLVAMLAGCSHDESTQAVDSRQTNVSAEFVSADEAKTIAAAVQFGSAETGATGSQATTRSASLDKKAVLNVTPVAETTGSTAFYVINYEGGGFMILSADKRVDPVLAYSETSTFPMNDPKGLPGGLVDWMTETKAYIQDVRMKNLPLTERMAAAWEPKAIQQIVCNDPEIPIPGKGFPPGHKNIRIGPLLTTTWDQDEGYNDFAPQMGCSNLENGRAYAGCATVAAAQVMKYYRHPDRYNWDAMPDGYSSPEIAKLLRDIGRASNTKYGCTGSKTSLVELGRGLWLFGYPGFYCEDYALDKVENELMNKRPVILSGANGATKEARSHAWVCDGYKRITIYDGGTTILEVKKSLHMNWGYSGYYNAWYSTTNWKPGANDYSYYKQMLILLRK